MERLKLNTLLVNDDDLNCNCEKLDIEGMKITDLGFLLTDLEKFDLIIYTGKKGTKILKSKKTKTGVIV